MKLLDQLRQHIRYRHYSIRTEDSYVYWVRYFVRFHRLRHPLEMAAPEVVGFLTYLANERNCAPFTHKQASCAILFLYKEVVKQELPWMTEIGQPKSIERLPVVLTREKVQALFSGFEGVYAPLAKLLYSTVQDLLGHADVKTTMIYTQVLKGGGGGVKSPLDTLT